MASIGKNIEKASNKAPTFSAFMNGDAVKRKINEVIGGKDGQKFITSIISAVSINPTLSECDHMTILSGGMQGQALNLSPSPQLGQYYLVPFEDKKRGCKVATFQIGYKGYIQLAVRSGYYKKLNVLAIKQGELVKFDPLNETIDVNLIDDEEKRENAETIGYYVMFEYMNGFKKAMYWSKAKMEAHADKYSKAFKLDVYKNILAGKIPQSDMWKYSSFWYKDFDAMAYKTMLRQIISKWGIMSIDLQTAIEVDNAVIKDDGTTDYVDQVIESESVEVIEIIDQETGEVMEENPVDDIFGK